MGAERDVKVRVQTWDGATWTGSAAWRVAGSRRQIVYLASDAGELLTFQRLTGRLRTSDALRIHPDDLAALASLPMRGAKPRSRDACAYPAGGIAKRGRGRPREDLTGRVVARLTVIGPAPDYHERPHWRCRCACGNTATVIVSSDNLRAAERGKGGVGSCGCLRSDGRTAGRVARRASDAYH